MRKIEINASNSGLTVRLTASLESTALTTDELDTKVLEMTDLFFESLLEKFYACHIKIKRPKWEAKK